MPCCSSACWHRRTWARTARAVQSDLPQARRKHGIAFYPFVLDGVVTRPELQLEDGMHPNAKGVATMVERMTPAVRDFVTGLRDTSN